MKMIVLAAVLAVGLTVAGCASDSDPGSGGPPAPGKTAPDFELQSLEGETVSLESLRGKYVMLNFWATWCGPCRVEMPYFEDIHRDPEWSDRGLVILAVNLGEPAELVQSFMDAFGLTFTVLLDSQHEVGMLYNARLIPTTYFLDKDGIIKDIKIGSFRDKAEIEQILSDLAAGE